MPDFFIGDGRRIIEGDLYQLNIFPLMAQNHTITDLRRFV